MSRDGEEETEPLSPDEAFGMLGNETRVRILQTLSGAEGPLSFTELRDRVGIRQGGQFNYHLDKLVGHFVGKTESGYTLRRPGRRVVQAILSGAVTEDPTVAPVEVAFACHHCGGPVEVSYDHGAVRLSCTECSGRLDDSTVREGPDGGGYGNLMNMPLPPAGVQDRTGMELLRAAATWGHLEAVSLSSDVCPRCAAPVELDVRVCEDHDEWDGLCERCGYRLAVHLDFRCTNCIHTERFPGVMGLLHVPEVAAFVGGHGLNTTSRGIEWGWNYGEEVLSVDPFEGRFTFTIDGDSLVLTVNETFDVVESERR